MPRVTLFRSIRKLDLDRKQMSLMAQDPIDLRRVGITPELEPRSRQVRTAQAYDLESHELLEKLAHPTWLNPCALTGGEPAHA